MSEELLKKVLAKLDSFDSRLSALEPVPEPEKDPLKDKAAASLRKLLSSSYSKEKLDAMSMEELIIASTLKEDADVGVEPPGASKTPKEDSNIPDVPESMRAHYNTEDKQNGSLII